MPTVDRVLPWRRNSAPSSVELAPLLAVYREKHPKASTGLITKAYDAAKAAHRHQVRKSGEAYIHHPLEVATVVAGMALDDEAVAAALLHDSVEDTGVSLDDVAREFGPSVAGLVDGVTKLERVDFASKEEQQAASVRKMFIAMAGDMRVLLIKLADRLHNMRTIAGLPHAKQIRIAQETLDIYAPLAHRLGMQDIRNQLEDLAFATLHPARYAELDHMVSVRAPERDLYLFQVIDEVRERLMELGIEAEVSGRPKHLWSIYEKMVVKSRAFEEIHDLVGIRVVVDSVKDCWAALGSIHATWAPVQGRFKDYVSMPKFNLYQSLHTTVIGPQGKPIEVQLRTREMHLRAEKGVAAHWAYKEGDKDAGSGKGKNEELPWLDRILDREQDSSDPAAFMASLKVDLVSDEVYVFTPKGRVITLARNSTPVDFAYAVHTEVGHACQGARVNGRMVPLRHHLQSGDTVEILTQAGSRPSQDWLKIVATPRAANKIRQWFSRERREDALATGKEALLKELRRQNLPVQKLPPNALADVASALNIADVDALHTAIGEHHVSPESVVQRIGRLVASGSAEAPSERPAEVRATMSGNGGRNGHGRTGQGGSSGVHVEGLDDVLVRLSNCCKPLPGDEIMGFVTKGRGVSVHRADCANAVSLSTQGDRLIDVEWDAAQRGAFSASIQVEALDRPSLLMEVSKALADQRVNIVRASMAAGDDRVATMNFEFELGDASQLTNILNTLKRIDGVYGASRVMENVPVASTPAVPLAST